MISLNVEGITDYYILKTIGDKSFKIKIREILIFFLTSELGHPRSEPENICQFFCSSVSNSSFVTDVLV